LSLVAVQSLEPVAEKSRYEMTKRSLDDIRSAIVSVQQSGGTALVSGFVTDHGFLPPLTSGPAFHSALTVGAGLPAFPVGGSAFGWRGPYLQSNVTTTQFVDGWGRPLSAQVQDLSGAPKAAFDSLSDRLVLSNAGPLTDSSKLATTTITGSMISATQLTVNLYGIDLNGNRITLYGDGAPLSQLPQVLLHGGLNPVDGLVTTFTGTVTATGTSCSCQFTPAFPQLLVGNRTLQITTPAATTTQYQTYSPTTQINLLPGTSPVVEVLVVRQTAPVEP
jgi:hypothetical protein